MSSVDTFDLQKQAIFWEQIVKRDFNFTWRSLFFVSLVQDILFLAYEATDNNSEYLEEELD